MSQWFRMYGEVLNDPKVQRLPGEDFKGWINILCLASMNEGAIPPVDEVAFALRLDPKKARGLLERLICAGLVTNDETVMRPHKWDQRQYKSDVSTDRVKRFRDRSKKQPKPVSGTPEETAPDTETEQSVPLSKDNGDLKNSDQAFWANSKSYLGPSKASLIGKWVGKHGREATAAAVGAAQVNQAVDPVSYIEGYFRKHRKQHDADDEMPIC